MDLRFGVLQIVEPSHLLQIFHNMFALLLKARVDIWPNS